MKTVDKFSHTRMLSKMFCKDIEPFDMVERAGFREYATLLKPNLEFPTARTVSTSGLTDVYNYYFKKVKQILTEGPQNFSVVVDMWSDNFLHLSYINLTIHFCKNFKLCAISLATEVFARPHTSLAVSEKISEILTTFDIKNRSFIAVTDGGKNLIAAMREGDIMRIDCVAHLLHRFIVHDVMQHPTLVDSIDPLIIKMKTIYRKLKYSTVKVQQVLFW